MDGVFTDMTYSKIYHTEVVDEYIGIFRARFELDEVELRTLAGQRKGTVGVVSADLRKLPSCCSLLMFLCLWFPVSVSLS